jgi:putative ATPase
LFWSAREKTRDNTEQKAYNERMSNEFIHKQKKIPLAERMRPQNLADYVGQEDIIAPGKILRQAIENDTLPSLILWGPPGSGKTTLAKVIAHETKSVYLELSATASGKKDIQEVARKAKIFLQNENRRTILFIDEIHRFNKAQQDVLLPLVEHGEIILIGATTENPSFEVNSALLSRARVFVLHQLSAENIAHLVRRALADEKNGYGKLKIEISDDAILFLSEMVNGDARSALNALELAVDSGQKRKEKRILISIDALKESLQRTHLLYDKKGEEHYNIISALHKSMRGGDANAALYWLGRMLEGGEDPLYVARRLVRFASEDIGIANSLALPQAIAAFQACHFIGMPECEVNLAQAVVYMAKSKKSNALYAAYGNVKNDIRELPAEPVPLHIRNAPTKLMKELGFGKNYKYTPDYKNPEDAVQEYLPERLKNKKYLPDDFS